MKHAKVSPAAAIAFLLAIGTVVAACVTVPRSERVVVGQDADCVVLLHGLGRSWRAMRPMANALQDAGFTTVNVDYPSHSTVIEELAPLAVNIGLDECRDAGAEIVHFVAHSIGGILLRYEQAQAPIPDLGRVVMLGPPNQGSEVIDMTRDWPGFRALSGEAGMQLGTDEDSIPSRLGPVDFEVGVIAGTDTINPFMSAVLPDEDDGKVSVERTKVEGMQDFMVVDKSHRFIVRADDVIAYTIQFLRSGRFTESTQPVSGLQ